MNSQISFLKKYGPVFIKKTAPAVIIYVAVYLLLFYIQKMILLKDDEPGVYNINESISFVILLFVVPAVSSIISTFLFEAYKKNGISFPSAFFTFFFVLGSSMMVLVLTVSVFVLPLYLFNCVDSFTFSYGLYNFLLYFISIKIHRKLYEALKPEVKMTHIFDPKDLHKLESPERAKIINPVEVLNGMKLKAGDTVLDFGVGTGFFATRALEITGETGFIYGVDISEEMIEFAKEKTAGHKNISFIKTDSLKIPLEDGLIDFAFMAFVLHEIDDRPLIINEMKRLLKTGGTLGIVEWDSKNFEKGPPEHERIEMRSVTGLLESSGFKITDTCNYSQYHYYLTAEKR